MTPEAPVTNAGIRPQSPSAAEFVDTTPTGEALMRIVYEKHLLEQILLKDGARGVSAIDGAVGQGIANDISGVLGWGTLNLAPPIEGLSKYLEGLPLGGARLHQATAGYEGGYSLARMLHDVRALIDIASVTARESGIRRRAFASWGDIVAAAQSDRTEGLYDAARSMYDVVKAERDAGSGNKNRGGTVPSPGVATVVVAERRDRQTKSSVQGLVDKRYPAGKGGVEAYFSALANERCRLDHSTSELLIPIVAGVVSLISPQCEKKQTEHIDELMSRPVAGEASAEEVVWAADKGLLTAMLALDGLIVPSGLAPDVEALKQIVLSQIKRRAYVDVHKNPLTGEETEYRPLNAERMAAFLEERAAVVDRASGGLLKPTPSRAAAKIALAAEQTEHDEPIKEILRDLISQHAELVTPFSATGKELRRIGFEGNDSLDYRLRKAGIDMPRGVLQVFAGLCELVSTSRDDESVRKYITGILLAEEDIMTRYREAHTELLARTMDLSSTLPRRIGAEVDWLTEENLLQISGYIRAVEVAAADGVVGRPPFLNTVSSKTVENIRRVLFPEPSVENSSPIEFPDSSFQDTTELPEGVTVPLGPNTLHGVRLPESLRDRGIVEFDFSVFPPDAGPKTIQDAVEEHFAKQINDRERKDVPIDWKIVEALLYLRDTCGGRLGMSQPGNLGKDGIPYFVLDLEINGRRVVVLDHVEYGNAAYILDSARVQEGYSIDKVIRSGTRAVARRAGGVPRFHPAPGAEDRLYTHLEHLLSILGLPSLETSTSIGD